MVGRHHVTNGELNVLDFSARLNEEHYECCEAPVSQLIYTITLKGRPMYFFLFLIFPVIAIVLLSLLIFKIPPDTGERIGFAVTILLTMGVYLMVISQDLPRKADNAPLVGILYVTQGVITAGMFFKITTPPQWLRRLVLKLTKRNSNKVGAIKNSFRNGDAQKETAMDEDAKSTMELTEPNERDDNVLPKEHGNALPRSILRRTTSLMMGNDANKSLQVST